MLFIDGSVSQRHMHRFFNIFFILWKYFMRTWYDRFVFRWHLDIFYFWWLSRKEWLYSSFVYFFHLNYITFRVIFKDKAICLAAIAFSLSPSHIYYGGPTYIKIDELFASRLNYLLLKNYLFLAISSCSICLNSHPKCNNRIAYIFRLSLTYLIFITMIDPQLFCSMSSTSWCFSWLSLIVFINKNDNFSITLFLPLLEIFTLFYPAFSQFFLFMDHQIDSLKLKNTDLSHLYLSCLESIFADLFFEMLGGYYYLSTCIILLIFRKMVNNNCLTILLLSNFNLNYLFWIYLI